MQFVRDRRRRVAHPGDLGHVRGQVAHPLQVGDHPQRRDQHAELVGDRRLPGHQLEDLLLDAFAGRIQLDVRRDDLFGLPDVGCQQRRRRAPYGGGHRPGHPLQLNEDVVELLVVAVTHCVRFRSVVSGCHAGRSGRHQQGTRSMVTVCRRGCRTATSGERPMNS